MKHDLSRLGAWADLPFFKDDLPRIEEMLSAETRNILPRADQRFAALEKCSPENTRVVILGQDPYPTPGHAHGLAFSVTPGTQLPRSLRNIFRELEADLGVEPDTGDLTHWADQGVLLLNTALSVPAGAAGAHAKLGWSHLTRQILTHLDPCPRAAILWGRPAQTFAKCLSRPHHLIVRSAHPSPLSANRGFFGSRPFSRVNTWLSSNAKSPIKWA
ncbi:MAG: uracil-DNA glycosylase [Pseudomonadota bacterium]